MPTSSLPTPAPRTALYQEVCSFINLRWIAGAAVLAGALANGLWLQWYPRSAYFYAIAAFILAYNAVLRLLVHPGLQRQGRTLLIVAWVQLLLDLACLTVLVIFTGGMRSPLALFYVFHMVFASLLLPRNMAYGAAVTAIGMLVGGLWLARMLGESALMVAGEAVTLGLTVFLANRVVERLRRQDRRLRRQNRRIRRISRHLKRHQRAMVQHEKMIALGQMAAGVAHEIANPLASMDSLLQLVQRRPERLGADTVSTLRRQIERMGAILQQMKDFAHPVQMRRETAALNDLVEQAVGMVRFDKRARRVKLETQLAADVGSLPLIPAALQQVVVNLLINAFDAVAEVESPHVVVRTERRDSAVLVEVTDNGPGIPEQHLRRLFEPFFTTKPVGQGTGLGLTISYSLVERQGGTITARSTPGQGATFTVRLPVVEHSRLREAAAGDVAVSENPHVA